MEFTMAFAESNEISKFIYDPESNTMIQTKSKRLEDIKQLMAINNNVLARMTNSIVLLDEDFNIITSKVFSAIESIYTEGLYSYVGADACFICLDENLNELSRVELSPEGRYYNSSKNVHDILIYNNVAYLLDNIVTPLYIFAIDISDRSEMRLIGKYDLSAVNAHLSLQFVNPTSDQWIVQEDYGVSIGSGEILHIFSMDVSGESQYARRGTEESIIKKGSRSIFRWTILEQSTAKGYRIKDILRFPDHWAVILDEQNIPYLAKVNTRNERIRFAYLTPLGFYEKQKTVEEANTQYWYDNLDYKIRRNTDYIFVCGSERQESYEMKEDESSEHITLTIFDMKKKKPKKLHQFDMNALSVNNISDFVVS